MASYTLTIISLLILAYLGWSSLYQFTFSLAGLFFKNPLPRSAKRLRRMAVFMPAYREDAVILPSVEAALKQNYPAHLYQIVVVADQLKSSTVQALKQLPIQVIEVQFVQSTKAKALNRALQLLRGWNFEVAVVLDADNVMQADFLDRINNRFEAGATVVQGRRMAKNWQTSMAMLDAASEDVNTHILCRGHHVLGLSARLAGSGMAFDYRLFERIMPQVKAIGGFDKELELRLTQAGISLEYDEQAVVFDEKVSHAQNFTRQRSRWLAAQYTYAARFVPTALLSLLTQGKLDFFNKSAQMLLPPRLMLPAILFGGTVINALFSVELAGVWGVFFGFNILSFLIAMPAYCFEKDNLKALLEIPRALVATFKALSQINTARQQFIHTVHHVA
jgi:cellulose synthase/poly-beta-1,6-N-acetylglucosamine synthase-like glycosyltransferase